MKKKKKMKKKLWKNAGFSNFKKSNYIAACIDFLLFELWLLGQTTKIAIFGPPPLSPFVTISSYPPLPCYHPKRDKPFFPKATCKYILIWSYLNNVKEIMLTTSINMKLLHQQFWQCLYFLKLFLFSETTVQNKQ